MPVTERDLLTCYKLCQDLLTVPVQWNHCKTLQTVDWLMFKFCAIIASPCPRPSASFCQTIHHCKSSLYACDHSLSQDVILDSKKLAFNCKVMCMCVHFKLRICKNFANPYMELQEVLKPLYTQGIGRKTTVYLFVDVFVCNRSAWRNATLHEITAALLESSHTNTVVF